MKTDDKIRKKITRATRTGRPESAFCKTTTSGLPDGAAVTLYFR